MAQASGVAQVSPAPVERREEVPTPSAPPSATAAGRESHTEPSASGEKSHQPATSDLTSSTSIDTFASTQSKRAYLDSLVVPPEQELERIAAIQAGREAEHRAEHKAELRRRSREAQRESLEQSPSPNGSVKLPQATHRHERIAAKLEKAASVENGPNASLDDLLRAKAASMIQRTYRGYRVRRQMKGLNVNASTRWVNAIREAQFREAIRPRAKEDLEGGLQPLSEGDGEDSGHDRHAIARNNWKRVAIIARRAAIGEEEDMDDEDEDDDESHTEESDAVGEDDEAKADARQRRREVKESKKQEAKMMGLQYFLEMVDLKHRYGSNLRRYHEVWKKSDTHENFFYWLDYGEGRFVEVDSVSRERLEKEQVRYLSREERQYYLVKVDKDGRLCWAKNGARIDTTQQWKDSIHGIVPLDDDTPQFHGVTEHPVDAQSSAGQTTEGDSDHPRDSSEDEHDKKHDGHNENTNDAMHQMRKIHQFSASKITDKFLRRSVKKNTWIFVADTNFRLYVGIKTSGAFQHSSFLQGSRIAAAGLIKIKNGRISSLSPLSGHYRPRVGHFKAFLASLREAGVDLSHVSTSKSYAVLLGLEAYVRTRQKAKKVVQKLSHPGEREEVDMSASAKKERKHLRTQENERDANKATLQLLQKLKIAPQEPAGQKGDGDDEKSAGTAAGRTAEPDEVTSGREVDIAADAMSIEK